MSSMSKIRREARTRRHGRVRKRVHFFLMLATGGDVSLHDAEMEDVRWFPLRTAIKRAAYRGERDVIRRAAERLE